MIGPRDQREVEEFARKLAQGIGGILKETYGKTSHFVLCLTDDRETGPGEQGFMTYVTDIHAESCAQLLHEIASKLLAAPNERLSLRRYRPPVRFTSVRRWDDSETVAHDVYGDGALLGTLAIPKDKEPAWVDHVFKEPPAGGEG